MSDLFALAPEPGSEGHRRRKDLRAWVIVSLVVATVAAGAMVLIERAKHQYAVDAACAQFDGWEAPGALTLSVTEACGDNAIATGRDGVVRLTTATADTAEGPDAQTLDSLSGVRLLDGSANGPGFWGQQIIDGDTYRVWLGSEGDTYQVWQDNEGDAPSAGPGGHGLTTAPEHIE